MSVRLTPRARLELGLYRAVAHLYRAGLAVRLLVAREPQVRQRLRERLGRWDGCTIRDGAIWVHAASLGEVLTVAPLLERIEAAGGRVVLTCHTATGYAAAASTAAEEVRCFPVDTPAAVRGVLGLVRPRAFLFVETEIWPSLLLLLADARVPSVMLNATVSERSFGRYRLVSSLVSAALRTLTGVCARDATSMRRLLELGAPEDRTIVTGDLKSEAFGEAALAAIPDLLARVPEQVLVAASTHESEDDVVLAAFASLRRRHPHARLVLAPRHPERGEAVYAAARARGFETKLRSRERAAVLDGAGWEVMVVDTTGELRGFMRSAAAVFVGGSLVDVGGHNLFEPAAFGRCVATGPHLDGVREQADVLSRHGALAVVGDADALAGYWSRCLDDPVAARRTGEAARAAVRVSGGALDRTMRVLAAVLGSKAPTDVTESRS